MAAIDNIGYIHWFFSDYMENHPQNIYHILSETKNNIVDIALQKATHAADIKVSKAFGGTIVTKELKEELFSFAGGKDNLQSRLQEHVAASAQGLNRASGEESTLLQQIADQSGREREAFINKKIEELEGLAPFISEANDMLDYYMKVEAYQTQVALALAEQTGEGKLVSRYLKEPLKSGLISQAKLSADVKEAIKNLNLVKRLNMRLQEIQGEDVPGSIKALNKLGRMYVGVGWKIKEIADAYALHVAISKGDANMPIKAFQSGKTIGSLQGTGLLRMAIQIQEHIDPKLSEAISTAKKSKYTRQIKADSFGFYTSQSGLTGVIELSSKNYQTNTKGLVHPVSLQKDITFERGIQILSRYAGNSYGDKHFYKNLIGARPYQRKYIKRNNSYSKESLEEAWNNYKDMVSMLTFVDMLSGEFSRDTFGNNAMFLIVNNTVISIYDIINKVRQVGTSMIKSFTNLNDLNRVYEENRAVKTEEERSTDINSDVQNVLNTTFNVKFNMNAFMGLT